MSYKIYAPCDGVVKPIKELNDGVFSAGLLGKGISFTPSENDFYAIVENATLAQIFETKHAYFFKIKGLENPVLMHIGIDTVTLNGEPFTVHQKENSNVDLNTKIVSVNLQDIKKANCLTETPIVFECDNKFDIKILKTGSVKKGEPLFEIYESAQENINTDENKPVKFIGKYDSIAQEIYKYVGTNTNYRTYRNCMTRLRFTIKNKEEVDLEAIKKISIVKGTNWSDNELQIIIGGEVYKVKDALDNYLANKDSFKTNNIKRDGFKTEVLNLVKGIILPMLPVMMAASILQALYTLLSDQVFNVFPSINLSEHSIADYSWFNVMLYIIAYPGTNFIGIFFIYCTIKYLNGNTVIGLLIGVTIISPYLFGQPVFEWWTIKIGDVSSVIGIKPYPTSVIPMICAGLVYVYFDKWVKTWMPTSVDIVFRHFLSVLVTCALTFMIMGNILGLFEALIGYIISLLNWVPFGLSTALFALVWQPLVLTGTHAAVWNAIAIPAFDGVTSVPILFGPVFGVFGQYGAAIGIAIKTKNANTRSAALGALPAATFGITEPLIFGSTLRNGLPFLLGCIGASVGGLVYTGMFNGDWFMPNAQGIFSFLSVGKETSQYIGWAVALLAIIGTSILLNILFFNERPNEIKATNKLNKKLIKTVAKLSQKSFKEIELELSNNLSKLDEILNQQLKPNIKVYELNVRKSISDAIKLNAKVSGLNNQKEKLAEKSNHLYELNKIEAMKKVNLKFKELTQGNKLEILEKKAYQSQILSNESINNLNKIQFKYMENVDEIINIVVSKTNEIKINNFKNNYFNVIHSLDIGYEITEKHKEIFTNKLLKQEEKNEKVRVS
ncbi:PTS glucose transporter subunit IIABC [Spiroplasma culicicola]|uniref:PTS system IIB component n=1 Tax=Spiroplasma culicicola AES-1 TaxID=1276246 RepID=W6A7Z2_9MOLU|nr:PTS glucose transporter subunit IIABC [Spiroplasma culicicola]AHI53005.1 PTS system IIB component [Spiroplasma culicicola AES-1]